TTKPDLIKAANEQFEKMWKLIDSMSDDVRNAAFNFGDNLNQKEAHWERDKNLRDVLVHLYEWHQLLLSWVETNQNGEEKPFLPEPYNWKTYSQMNVKFWEKHQSTSYENAKELLCGSHKKVSNLMEQFTNEELFERKHFAWTGTTSLGAYCVSATSSHYDWAMKKIKAHIKAYRGPCRCSEGLSGIP
ncbi:MAG: ClbS/DfsB family four-helix bundle protein, partial [Bacillota bacterium]